MTNIEYLNRLKLPVKITANCKKPAFITTDNAIQYLIYSKYLLYIGKKEEAQIMINQLFNNRGNGMMISHILNAGVNGEKIVIPYMASICSLANIYRFIYFFKTIHLGVDFMDLHQYSNFMFAFIAGLENLELNVNRFNDGQLLLNKFKHIFEIYKPNGQLQVYYKFYDKYFNQADTVNKEISKILISGLTMWSME